MESFLELNCFLCLQKCSRNAMEEITYPKLKEATDFVFTFKMLISFGNHECKVCHRCVNCIMDFYEYAMLVKTNQESIRNFTREVKEEPAVDELCSIKIEPLQEIPDCDNVSTVEIVPDYLDGEKDDGDTSGDDMDANGSAQSKNSDLYPTARKKRIEVKPWNCACCGESFSHKLLLKTHMKMHLDCKDCGKIFPDKDSHRDHMKTTHKNKDRIVCDKCGKIFKKYNLNAHIKASHSTGPSEGQVQDRLWQCKFCLKKFHNSATLRSHIQAIHKEADRTFTCDVCQRVYPTSRSLRGHKARVHVERKYCCSVCNKLFKRQVNFKEHMAAHTGVMLYECDVCGHKFNSNANMYVHIKRKHPEEWNEKQKDRQLGRRRQNKCAIP